MTEKSHVSLEAAVCPVCGRQHQTGNVLLDKHLKASMERETVTGWKLCEEHQKLYDNDMIALVECKNSTAPKLETADRTGVVCHIKERAFKELFDIPSREDDNTLHPMIFVEVGVIQKLQAMTEREKTE